MKNIRWKTIVFIITLLLWTTVVFWLSLRERTLQLEWLTKVSEKQEIVNKELQNNNLLLIQNDISYEKENIEYYKNNALVAQKKYESIIWRIRCLEIKWELELKWKENSLECKPYIIDEMMWVLSDENYNELEKFSTYNIQNTKVSLGL